MSTSSVIPATSVPAIQFTPQGVIVPSDTDILAGVQIDINAALGGGLNPALTTPQGQIATSETAIISDKNSEILNVSNQVDPQFASGRFQDAIGRIYFMQRKQAAATVVQCVLTGLPNTPIPAGTLARDTSGNTYALSAAVTIGAGSTVLGNFANVVTGPIPCPAGTLIQVFQAIPGWDTITNQQDGTLGNDVESRNDFEFRRQNSVAVNGSGTVQAINALVFGVTNVIDCYVIDNSSGNPQSSNPLPGGIPNSTNYNLLPNSLYVAVVGGAPADIVQAIWTKKDVGCNYNGNTTLSVADDRYDFPQPTYNVSYEIPTSLPILFAVQIINNPSLPSNIVSLVQQAIINQFNGVTPGSLRARIASLILATSYYGAAAGAAPNVLLQSLLVGTTVANQTSVQVGIDQNPTIAAANITVTLV